MKENSNPQAEATIPFEPLAQLTQVTQLTQLKQMPADPAPASTPAPARRMHPDEQARLVALSEGNQLGNVETYARDFTRSEQAGERDRIQAALASAESELRMHREKGQRAERLRSRTDDMIPQPGSRPHMSGLSVALLLFMLLGLLGAIGVEQYGASLALVESGAYSVDSIGKGILLTMTAVTVGFALKLAYSALPQYLRRWTFLFACVALVGLFVTWAWNFAVCAGQAAADNARIPIVQAGSPGEANPLADAKSAKDTRAEETTQSAAWMMFFALVSMMPLTAFIGHVGVEHYIEHFKVMVPNPVYQKVEDDIRFHEGEITLLNRKQSEYHKSMAILLNAEHSAVSHSRTLYLAERARLNGIPHGAPGLHFTQG